MQGGGGAQGVRGESVQHSISAQPVVIIASNVGLLVQEVLQRLRQRRMSRLSHSQHEIEGILQCSEPEEGMSDSADELEDPAGHQPAAGPDSHHADQTDQADIEDMGALAHGLQDDGMEEQQHQQQAAGESRHLSVSNLSWPLSVSVLHLMFSLSRLGYIPVLSVVSRLSRASLCNFNIAVTAKMSVRALSCLPQLQVSHMIDRVCCMLTLADSSSRATKRTH